jgi:hypothetical protein
VPGAGSAGVASVAPFFVSVVALAFFLREKKDLRRSRASGVGSDCQQGIGRDWRRETGNQSDLPPPAMLIDGVLLCKREEMWY